MHFSGQTVSVELFEVKKYAKRRKVLKMFESDS